MGRSVCGVCSGPEWHGLARRSELQMHTSGTSTVPMEALACYGARPLFVPNGIVSHSFGWSWLKLGRRWFWLQGRQA